MSEFFVGCSLATASNSVSTRKLYIDLPHERSPEKSDPWIANMEIFQDDPTFDDFLAEINTYRNGIDTAESHS
jgi:hypothetical protein